MRSTVLSNRVYVICVTVQYKYQEQNKCIFSTCSFSFILDFIPKYFVQSK